MSLKTKVGERGQVVIPKGIRDSLSLRTGAELEVNVEGGKIVLQITRQHDSVDAAIDRYKGSKRGVLKSLGYASVDDYLKATRGR